MANWWRDLDRILRGEATRPSGMRRGTIEVAIGGLSFVLLLLAMAYGACMGSYAILKGNGSSAMQMLATMLKVPALFALTLAVTLPSLYVSNSLVGSRLSPKAVLRLLAATLAVIVAPLASLGPIVAFFSVSTTSYPFMVLLNVAAFAISGVLGASFLLQTMHRLSLAPTLPPSVESVTSVGDEKPVASLEPPPGALDPTEDRAMSRNVKLVFRCWLVLFGLVGAQMGWVLRPFLGAPGSPFVLFRPRESNFFEAVWRAFWGLFS